MSVQKLKTFLGIIMMTYIKYPFTRMYWSSVPGLRMDTIANSMSDKNMNHKLFMDNLFTTLHLLQNLQSFDIFVVGTLQTNRIPKEIRKKLPDSKLLSHGMSAVVTSSDNITIVRWIDNNPVHTISTYAGSFPENEVKRWDRFKTERIEIPRLFSIEQYNMLMGGVDLMDRMIAHYPHGFKNKRWYQRLFFHLVNMALVNSWYLFKLKNQDHKMPLLTFKASVATALINLGTSRKRMTICK
ncbi:hypothetical protein PR048_013194 [Dryococelus australis]|uniref:PiggyBac transposable element-derived protein domain-containing protein n=1 Tax=Dryococelus australis TaxID=614101 RepID=A0ABQ9HRG1_9NEOP|nr:hypothetical protein PR048_013194 [Dryococelus australis]